MELERGLGLGLGLGVQDPQVRDALKFSMY